MKTYVIAEAGVNHNRDKSTALKLIDVAAAAGADAVKFQTFNADKLASSSAPKASYQKSNTGKDESQLAMLKSLELPLEWHLELEAHAHQVGIEFLSTAFDQDSLAFLETLDLPFYKVPSGEITNGPLLLSFARTGKRIILSTGMSSLGEVERALAILAWGYLQTDDPISLEQVWRHWATIEAGAVIAENLTLLHCTSQYPTPMEEVNLLAMGTMSKAFGLPTGYSDHTHGLLVPSAAVAMGATIIEKHFTLDRNLPGPDHLASLEPDELKQMIEDIRQIEILLGDGRKLTQASEWDTRAAARQRIVATRKIAQGEQFGPSNLGTARTGKGELPVTIWDRFGQKSAGNFEIGDSI
tara:strand:- start:860 stop:1924 length:1065 start_codon:yes stop_codon:yes gene_type:complete